MKKKTKSILGSILVLVLIVGFVPKSYGKFIGREIDGVTDWADGTCAYRNTCSTYYVAWIAVSSGCTTETIGCIQ